jgi:hypothetical protein
MPPPAPPPQHVHGFAPGAAVPQAEAGGPCSPLARAAAQQRLSPPPPARPRASTRRAPAGAAAAPPPFSLRSLMLRHRRPPPHITNAAAARASRHMLRSTIVMTSRAAAAVPRTGRRAGASSRRTTPCPGAPRPKGHKHARLRGRQVPRRRRLLLLPPCRCAAASRRCWASACRHPASCSPAGPAASHWLGPAAPVSSAVAARQSMSESGGCEAERTRTKLRYTLRPSPLPSSVSCAPIILRCSGTTPSGSCCRLFNSN